VRKWLITMLIAAGIVLLGFAVRRWSVALLAFVDLNGGRIQTLADMVQLLIWTAIGSWFMVRLWRPHKAETTTVQPTSSTRANIAEGDRSVAIGGNAQDVTINTGNRIEGDLVERDKVTNIILVNQPGPSERLSEGTDLAGQIREACRSATNRLANILRDERPVIVREMLRHKLNQLLASSLRYGFLLGASGVGKSTFMGTEARRLFEEGWTVMLVRGSNFTLNNLAEAVRQEIVGAPPTITWQQIVNALREGAEGEFGFVLLVDALDNGAPDSIARELALLHDSLGDTDPRLFKVIASCKDADWHSLLQYPQAPAYEEVKNINRRIGLGYYTLQARDFTPEELNDALRLIGAIELLTPGRFGERVDPHVATVRDLLKHPATFEHYADLHLSGDPASTSNLTWGGLLEQRLRKALNQAARQCGNNADDMRAKIIAFAVLCRERNSREALLDSDEVRQAIPDLFTSLPNALRTPYEALMGHGILVEQPTLGGRHSIGFRITDAAGYLLSFDMEHQSDGVTNEEYRALVTRWIDDAWNYSPLLDALLALADRLGENPRDNRLLILLDVLLEEHRSYNDLFRLMRPTLIISLFELIVRNNPEYIHTYRDAAVKVRSSEAMLAEVRHRLQDPDSRIRAIAVELVGIHRDVRSTSALTRLLEDQEEEVSRATWIALGRIGVPAIAPLLEIADDSSQPVESRSHCIAALRAIGFRNEEVSAAIAHCLEDAEVNRYERLLRNALLTAAHLRDRGHTASAIRALEHEDDDVVQATAKLLTEVPESVAFNALRQSLFPQFTPGGEIRERYWLPRQLIAALVASDAGRAEPVILEMIREGLEGAGELRPVGALEAAEKTGLPAAYSLVLEDLVIRLERQPNQGIVLRSAELLGKTWYPQQLAAMVEMARNLNARNLNVARLFVNAVAPNMRVHDEFPTGDGINRVKDLHGAIKCQADGFIPEASALLADARALSTMELCELFWVAGDTSAEEWLLYKLEHPASTPERVRNEKGYILRALGTCGTERAATVVLDYARQGQDISIYFPQEALVPLVQRGVLSVDSLTDVVRDPSAPVVGRALCLSTLGTVDVRAHQELFAWVAREVEVEMLQRQAVRLLGFGIDASLIPYLHGLLRNSPHRSVKAEAAVALARLNARQTIHDVERALEDINNRRFVEALAIFREESSLPFVINALQTVGPQFRGMYLEALAAFSQYPQGGEAVREQFEEWASGEPSFWNYQSPLIRGLARHNPALLLERVIKLYDEGLLNSDARSTLAGRIPRLFHSDETDKILLRDLVSRLICDRDAETRDITVHSLRRTSEQFCFGVYETLNNSRESDEWSRACAVYALGLWDNEHESNLVESLCYGSELLVRRAADNVVESIRRHQHLQTHLDRYNRTEGLSRLSAYLCLKKQGTVSTIWSLRDDTPKGAVTQAFVRHVSDRINKRLEGVYRKRQEEDKKIDESRGTIWFS
jgi:HEAT repeat protein